MSNSTVPTNQGSETSGSSSGPIFWGVIAIAGGAVLILSQWLELDTIMPWVTLCIGVAMLLWGMLSRSVGGLIPGGIVTGVGLGLTVITTDRIDASEQGAGLFLLLMALGFLSIPITTKIFIHEMHWWAFIPAGIIAVVGLALIFGGVWFQALNLVQLAGAAALIGLGCWLIYKQYRRSNREPM